ncbi:MAG: glycosyltransferase [Lachnospiraceae bacterium]|jgi:glycosyltransferase involved in cell wall biosynthesis|nr:glycosyltransferase [Lachnospiraceae bacterium]
MISENKKNYPAFSVAISVYGGDNADYFDLALKSIMNQTIPPDEIVLIIDGPVSDTIEKVIKKHEKGTIPFTIIKFKKNKGLGMALKVAVEHAHHNIIARMDSDDIAYKNRFALQLQAMCNYSADIVGGQISEFDNSEKKIIGYRIVPLKHKDICEEMKKRCPLNHMTVMFKKNAVLQAGNYRSLIFNEDYFLWIRMMESGCIFMNLKNVLVNVRCGKDMYKRRGGQQYFKSECTIQKFMLNRKIISPIQYIINISKRFIVQIILPNHVRGLIIRKFARIHPLDIS